MKRTFSVVILFLLVLVTLTGCSGNSYFFEEPVEEIHSIEIVSAESSLEYTVLKTLSETEKEDFVEQFLKIEFYNYYIGDPMSVNGNAVKIAYANGNYEMICPYWSEYVKDGVIQYRWKNCNKNKFNELLNKFL